MDAMVLKNMDMVKVIVNEIRTKKKKAPGSLRRWVIKYSTRLKKMALRILYGMSVSIEAKASQDG
jgi:hypothetical protein